MQKNRVVLLKLGANVRYYSLWCVLSCIMDMNANLHCSPHIHSSSADAGPAPIIAPAPTPPAVAVPEELSATEVVSERDVEASPAVDPRPQKSTPNPSFGNEVRAEEEVCQAA